MKKKLRMFHVWGLLALMLLMGGVQVSAACFIDDWGKIFNDWSGHYGKKVVTALKLDQEDFEPSENIGNRIHIPDRIMVDNVLEFDVTQPCTLHITGSEVMFDKDGEPECIGETDSVKNKKIDISVEKESGIVIKKGTVKWNMELGEVRSDGQKNNICINVPITSAGRYQIRVTSKVKNTEGICLHIVSVDNTASDVKAKKVKVKFDPNGGKIKNKTISFTTGKQYGTLPKPTRKGYTFSGWYTAKKGGTSVTEETSVKKAVTLYARWKKIKYKIQYNCKGGKNAKANPTSYTVTSKKITLRKPTRKGYTFAGWYNAKGKKVKVISSGSAGDIKLKAKWKRSK